MAWSSSDSASRAEPSAARAIRASAPSSIFTFSFAAMLAQIGGQFGGLSMRRRSKRWQRDSTVTGTLRISVVAKMNFTCGGGSSSVLSIAVEGLLGQHMHFVEDIDLVARRGRGIAHALDDLADYRRCRCGGGVHLLHIDIAGFGDGDAGIADAAGMDGGLGALAVGSDAVERAGDDAGGGGFAHPAHAGEHEGMGDAAGGEGVGQRAHQRFLPDQAGEIGGAVFARQDAIGFLGRAKVGRIGLGHGATIARAVRQRRGNKPIFVEKVEARHDPNQIRYGCFLPDLTGLATVSSAPNSHARYREFGWKLRVRLPLRRSSLSQVHRTCSRFAPLLTHPD